ncbi:MAG: DUF4405 domain-containing protein [Anaerolineae bacterium]|nr:DUF4405 domain-containing protein [Anaerolineae bacterium]
MASITAATPQTQPRSRFRWLHRTQINVFLDILLVLAFVVEMEEHFTGLALHEVIGVFLTVALVLHLLLHLDWVVKITLRFFHQIIHESRFNYLLNLALLITMGVALVTGFGISRTLGLPFDVPHSWESLHRTSAEWVLLLTALHVAMHWKWIATNVRKYIFGWFPIRFRSQS